MVKKRSLTEKRFALSLILAFFVASVLLGTNLPAWCAETDIPSIGMRGPLRLAACHTSLHESSILTLLMTLSTIPAHGDNQGNSCGDVPISSAKAFQTPASFAKELGKQVVLAVGYCQPFTWFIQNTPLRPAKAGMHTSHPNQLLASLRSVVLLI